MTPSTNARALGRSRPGSGRATVQRRHATPTSIDERLERSRRRVAITAVGPDRPIASAPAGSSDVGVAPPRIAPADTAPETSTSFQFLRVGANGPVAWDPSNPIRYRLFRPDLPPGGQDGTRTLLSEVTDICGYRFLFDGWIDHLPVDLREVRGHVVLGWASADATIFSGEPDQVGGVGGFSEVNGRPTGGLALVRAAPRRWQRQPSRRELDVLRHEIGHLLGLGHVDDARQVMYPSSRRWGHGFGQGDQAGLRALAAAGCRQDGTHRTHDTRRSA